ncbi:peptidase S8 and S53 subtilisin kexin sedolisin [Emticicia oligotrophica DSM 17448]|uniref:Peptidase S8 and S53 subtilisin kexin sedolisin n=1 Tax=Emticicia oligotrophica (strain DSM 17448 / CIP 109782 / MTCC 6937 / GPTSA100-15) TaxID=929562 RepID=A0ABM5MZL3_EMTOG|nr:S8 family serine peptidase [Emticicia oligotrophica]AFK02592.1 peptidase S8 and S53 subtilisin kexin sedolisin [Emticicia oligotrophica DSM 17448]
MKIKLLLIFLLGCTCFSSLHAQIKYKYLVLLKDKINSPYSVNNPLSYLSQKAIDRRFKQGIKITTNDLPPNPAYIDAIKQTGATVIYKSRWMNAVLVEATETQKNTILSLNSVKSIEFNRPLKQARARTNKDKFTFETVETLNYGDATAQIQLLGADVMHNQGFHGEGILVALLDDGYLNVNTSTCLQHLVQQNKILKVYDFVDNDNSVYEQGGHGTSVLSTMAGFIENQIIGPAFGASFALFRTEDNSSETPLEEANWLFAAEMADSVGADIISSSLGYSTFDNSADDYTPSMMDGKTALSTRAADFAAATGMVVVVSAGNSGDDPSWQIITAPADADSVLAIGAVSRSGVYAFFSSIGNSADGRIKPDVVAVGSGTALCNTSGTTSTSNGTSFSAPLVAGLVAGFWQAFPYLTAQEVIQCIRKSGHQFASPTIQLGYGYANFSRASTAAQSEYSLTAIEPSHDIVSVSILPSNKLEITLKFSNQLINNNLRIGFIEQSSNQIIYQDTFILNTNETTKVISLSTLNPDILLRIEDLTQKKTLKIMRW